MARELTFKMYCPYGGKGYTLTGEQMIKELLGFVEEIKSAMADESGTGFQAGRMCGNGIAIHCVETDEWRSRYSEKEFFEALQFKS